MDNVINSIYETNNYSIFKLKIENREINRQRVEKLKKQLLEDGRQISPIIVNKYYEIYEGQHRYQALKELGWNIKYFIDNDLKTSDIKSINISQNKWNVKDYIHANAGTNESYKKIEYLTKRYNLNIRTISLAVKGTNFIETNLKYGNVYVKDSEFEAAVEKLNWLEPIMDKLKKIPQKRIFESIMIKCYLIPGIDRERLANKITENIMNYSFGNEKQCLQAIQDIYNYKLGNEKRIYFEKELRK